MSTAKCDVVYGFTHVPSIDDIKKATDIKLDEFNSKEYNDDSCLELKNRMFDIMLNPKLQSGIFNIEESTSFLREPKKYNASCIGFQKFKNEINKINTIIMETPKHENLVQKISITPHEKFITYTLY
jgi:hypothetical protein